MSEQAVAARTASGWAAATVGIPLYTVFGALGLWLGSLAWTAMAADEVEHPTVLAGTMVATAIVSVVTAVIGVPAVALILARPLAASARYPRRAAAVFTVVGAAAAVLPGVFIALGSGHVGAGATFALLALILPAALTGLLAAFLLPAVAASRAVATVFAVAALAAVALVVVWTVVQLTPIGG